LSFRHGSSSAQRKTLPLEDNLAAAEGDGEAAATFSAKQTGKALFQDSAIQEPEAGLHIGGLFRFLDRF
jgi:hypothetical protein